MYFAAPGLPRESSSVVFTCPGTSTSSLRTSHSRLAKGIKVPPAKAAWGSSAITRTTVLSLFASLLVPRTVLSASAHASSSWDSNTLRLDTEG